MTRYYRFDLGKQPYRSDKARYKQPCDLNQHKPIGLVISPVLKYLLALHQPKSQSNSHRDIAVQGTNIHWESH
jgi:hypothetical protein